MIVKKQRSNVTLDDSTLQGGRCLLEVFSSPCFGNVFMGFGIIVAYDREGASLDLRTAAADFLNGVVAMCKVEGMRPSCRQELSGSAWIYRL